MRRSTGSCACRVRRERGRVSGEGVRAARSWPGHGRLKEVTIGTSRGLLSTTETLRRAIEGNTGNNLLSLYTDDAEIPIVDRDNQPNNPRSHGRGQIAKDCWTTSTAAT